MQQDLFLPARILRAIIGREPGTDVGAQGAKHGFERWQRAQASLKG